MPKIDRFERIAAAAERAECDTSRRALFFTPLVGALAAALPFRSVEASPINPSETSVIPPSAIDFGSWIKGFPPHSGEMATLHGGLDKQGPYVVFMKWYPGFMSAPHTYATDRLSVVISGTWWVNSGADFDPRTRFRFPPAALCVGLRARRTMTAFWRTPRSRPSLRCSGSDRSI